MSQPPLPPPSTSPEPPAPARRPSWQPGCLGCLGFFVGAVVLLLVSLYAWAGGFDAPSFEYEPSPDGRYEVVREGRSFFLDSFTRLWLTERGVRDRSAWFPLAPEVDGTWWADWRQPTELMLTDYGAFAEERDTMPVRFWRDVRIERRRPARSHMVDAPDARHHVTIWTEEDSYGRRQFVWLQSAWNVEPKLFARLLPSGPWQVDATWLAADHVQLRVAAEAGTAFPAVPARCGAIRVSAVGRR